MKSPPKFIRPTSRGGEIVIFAGKGAIIDQEKNPKSLRIFFRQLEQSVAAIDRAETVNGKPRISFENMVLGNEPDAAEELDKIFASGRAKSTIDSHKTWEHDGEGDTGLGHHEMPSVSDYLFGWF